MLQADFPEALRCLFTPSRYKVLYGGRGAGRSWGVARALLLIGTQKPIRILCAREFQNSMSDSVHKLLSDQIEAMGMSGFYTVLQKNITGANGTVFSFEGIKNNTTRIKSYEGIDYCWVEEAVKVSRASWGILIPTIRKPGSEIWMTFNPELEKDYTYRRFVLEADESVIAQKMTWRDNPFFPQVLMEELERDRERDYDYYLNVWEGHCLQQLEGAVYAKQLRKATEAGRICAVPWDEETPVDTFWDLGKRDRTAIWFGQRVAMQYRVLRYYEASGEDLPHFIKYCQGLPYVYGTMHLPHDARATRMGQPKSVGSLVRGYGFKVHIVPKLALADGINAARLFFAQCWFDEKGCEDGLDRLRHYRYKVVDGQFSDEPLHDEASDGADAFRYMAIAAKHGGGERSEIRRRLEAAAQALRGGAEREYEFGATRPRANLGWLQ